MDTTYKALLELTLIFLLNLGNMEIFRFKNAISYGFKIKKYKISNKNQVDIKFKEFKNYCKAHQYEFSWKISTQKSNIVKIYNLFIKKLKYLKIKEKWKKIFAVKAEIWIPRKILPWNSNFQNF